MVMYPTLPDEADESDSPLVLSAAIIQKLALVYDVSTTGMAQLLGMSRHVVWRRIHRRGVLPPRYQVRAMGAIRLYVLALDLYDYRTIKGRREARRWVNDWLRTPRIGFKGRRPIEFLSSDEGQRRLLTLLTGIAVGVYM